MYQIQIRVETIPVGKWLELYWRPEKFLPLCRKCPEYGTNWSCPPGTPSAEDLTAAYKYAQVIGMKIIYEDWVREASLEGPEQEEKLQCKTYGAAKKQLLQALLALEQVFPDSLTIMAGRCERCEHCARAEGKACRHPEQMRYSFSGLGFDLGSISGELLKMPLLWQNRGLPEYHVAVAAFLHN